MADTAAGAPGAAPTAGQLAAENVTNNKFQPGQVDAQGKAIAPAAGNDAGGATQAAAQEAMRKFKVKVDDKEVEVDEDELKKGYTHSRAAAKRFQEGSKAKAQAESFIQMMKDEGTLFDAIKKLGHDPRALAEKYLAAQIQEELMDPKDRELKTYQQKVKTYEEAEAKRKEFLKQQEHEKLKSKYAKEFENMFIDALKTSGLPQTKPMVAEMAKYIKRAADIGYQLTPQDAAKLVREDEEARIQGVVGESEAEILVKMLGEKTLQKLRDYDTKRVKDPNARLNTPAEQADGTRQKDKNVNRMTPAEWRAYNRK